VAERRPPSAARLRRALAAGDTPASSFAVRAASLVVAAALLPALARAVAARFDELLRAAIAHPDAAAPTALPVDVATLAAPVLCAALVAALAAGMSQTGLTLSPRPARRIGRFFDGLRAHDVVRALLVAIAVAGLGLRAIASGLPVAARAVGHPRALLDVAGEVAQKALWPCVALVVALAFADVLVRRAVWLRRLSPTPEEARRERSETEGDPVIRAARRRIHEQLTR
jgi:flagellar biosynthesis protein FlhB